MPRNFLFWMFAFALALILAYPQIAHGQMRRSPGMMSNPGMGHGGDAQTIHQLFANHNQVHRSVQEIPGGIRAVTESDNPQVVALIQSHVAKMYDRVSKKQFIPMIGMSSTLPTMLQEANHYQRQLRMTTKGIEVTETSNNPEMVALIREHAREVTQFAEQGMPAMMNGGMR